MKHSKAVCCFFAQMEETMLPPTKKLLLSFDAVLVIIKRFTVKVFEDLYVYALPAKVEVFILFVHLSISG